MYSISSLLPPYSHQFRLRGNRIYSSTGTEFHAWMALVSSFCFLLGVGWISLHSPVDPLVVYIRVISLIQIHFVVDVEWCKDGYTLKTWFGSACSQLGWRKSWERHGRKFRNFQKRPVDISVWSTPVLAEGTGRGTCFDVFICHSALPTLAVKGYEVTCFWLSGRVRLACPMFFCHHPSFFALNDKQESPIIF